MSPLSQQNQLFRLRAVPHTNTGATWRFAVSCLSVLHIVAFEGFHMGGESDSAAENHIITRAALEIQ